MTQTDLIALARKAADRFKLDQALVCAICEQESSWDPWVIRYEPEFYTRYVAPLGHEPTEARARSFSWGLMQIMGEVARELGYGGHLAALCDPAHGLTYGCFRLASLLDKSNGDTSAALQKYNGGGNPAYAAQVLARIPKYR